MKHLIFCLLVSMASISFANAQISKDNPTSEKAAQSADNEFIMKAAESGVAEVMLGKLAQDRAQSGDVRSYGKMMEKDHSDANRELQNIALKKGVQVPVKLSQKHQADYDALRQKSETEFDRAFMDQMIKDHEAAIALFENEAKNGKDADIRSWAEKTLPVLREHLQHAKDVQAKIIQSDKK